LASLSVVIPAYNEEARLPSTLDAVLVYLGTKDFSFVEVIVVDDGSRDGTAALVERRARDNAAVRLLRNPGNRGKGYTVRHGILEAKGDWILYTDADLSAPIGELDKLLESAERAGAQVAIGSRAVDRSLVGVHQSAFRELSGRAFNLIMRLITGLPFRDTQCGFKLFHRAAAREIFSRQKLDGFSFDVEDLVIAQARGYRAIEVPVVWNNVIGTKVSTLAGIKSFADLLGIRWRALIGIYRP
jgi:dolichyl-phosphate beta-glucosyltransferase